jgi:hypothetical protein
VKWNDFTFNPAASYQFNGVSKGKSSDPLFMQNIQEESIKQGIGELKRGIIWIYFDGFWFSVVCCFEMIITAKSSGWIPFPFIVQEQNPLSSTGKCLRVCFRIVFKNDFPVIFLDGRFND